ncbi:DNA repair helicase XPB [Desmospora profundinema]|uniref:DNA 3'-5' helicase n=1 Tax=Desmospora profundinema TaxID=1571184 RepID=A0ABU1IKG4_9BACL|nr:DNA repair helicase XPB [Desmospora profundinema]MDR6225270.1 DNA excision repair protein ERCC-3 [Desmospora profundinema]
MQFQPDAPLIVEGMGRVLLEEDHLRAEEVRMGLAAFAHQVKTPEGMHTFRLTPLSLWNAAASGWTAGKIVSFLRENSQWGVPRSLEEEIEETMERYGLFRLETHPSGSLLLICEDPERIRWVADHHIVGERLVWVDQHRLRVDPVDRGWIKEEMMRLGYPVADGAGYEEGEPLTIRLRDRLADGEPFRLRDYQKQAVEVFNRHESGVLVLPCGAGKTVIGLAALAQVGRATLILTPNATSVQQWIREITEKTDLSPDDVGEYTAKRKNVRPITVATYQILTHRDGQDGTFTHLDLFDRRDWGFIIYDEVHLLPAPVFRATAELQARRRLGLTATLVREDGREGDVFTLIGPKRFEMPWKWMEQHGWIAKAECVEVRVSMGDHRYQAYREAKRQHRYRIAAENPNKLDVLEHLVSLHGGKQVLVIGQYLSQLQLIAERLRAPLITGSTPQGERESLYRAFREGEIGVLVVSKVANFAVDLPDTKAAIQVSGTFGSRQEEAQRLGRILRPKEGENRASFYNIVTRNTVDQEYAWNRRRFLVEQGYRYRWVDAEQWN